MARVILSFLLGLAAGLAGTYGVLRAMEAVVLQGMLRSKAQEFDVTGQYEAWYSRKIEQPLLGLCVAGGFICGTLCGLRATRGLACHKKPMARMGQDEAPLSPSEFERVLTCCLFAPLAQREPAFVQGVIVGRLVDSEPELARRVDRFSPSHMQALWTDLVRSSGLD